MGANDPWGGARCVASLQQDEMVWTCRTQQSLDFSSTQAKPSCTEKIRQAKEKWEEVLLEDKKKLGMDTADPQNRSDWSGRLRRSLVKQVNPL